MLIFYRVELTTKNIYNLQKLITNKNAAIQNNPFLSVKRSRFALLFSEFLMKRFVVMYFSFYADHLDIFTNLIVTTSAHKQRIYN